MIPSVCPPARDNILLQIMAGPESPFTEAQLKEIILQHGKLGGPTRVRRWFMKQYKDIPNSRIPSARQFGKVIDRFKKNGSVHKQDNGGRKVTVMTEENIELVRVLVDDNQSLSIAEISQQTGLSTTIVWRILRKKLKLYPY